MTLPISEIYLFINRKVPIVIYNVLLVFAYLDVVLHDIVAATTL